MTHTKIKMYGTLWCSDCKRTKKFFGEQRVHYEFIDVDQAASAAGEGAAAALGIRRYLESRASGLPRREDVEAAA